MTYRVLDHPRKGQIQTLTLRTMLPLVQESFTRTFQLVDGENVLTISSELENLLAFDPAVNWAEHATIGPPFLERSKTAVDMPARPREHSRACSRRLTHNLALLYGHKGFFRAPQ